MIGIGQRPGPLAAAGLPRVVVAVLVAAAFLIVPGVTAAKLSPEQKCQAGKNKLAGTYAACRQKAEATLAKKNDVTKYTNALGKCAARFAKGWPKLEAKAVKAGTTCLDGTTTADTFASLIDDHTSHIAQALAGGALATMCEGDLAMCEDDLATCEADAAPTIASISMSTSSNFGGTTITVLGTGFVNNAAGPTTVTIGGTPATDVVVVDDTTLTCVTPAGPAGSAPLALTNAYGTAASPYSLFEPILVADGGGSPVPATWDLWAFDPITASAHMVGPIGFGLTSMDFDPVTGTLFGFTAPGALGPPRQLISINPVTGAGTLIASTDDAGLVNHLLQGASFVGNVVHGVDGPGANLVTVNTTTGLVTVLFPGRPLAPGGGFAADATSANVFYMTADVGPLDAVNIGTGAFTPGPLLNGFAAPGGRINAAAFHQGTLYGLHAPSPGGGGSPRQILSVNTTTGLLTPVGPVLPSPYASAIASRTR